MGDWWQRDVVEPGKLPLLLCLAAFVVCFLVTRTITRMIRAGRGAIVWSPCSNIWLYGGTTDVLGARHHGHLVCLGSD